MNTPNFKNKGFSIELKEEISVIMQEWSTVGMNDAIIFNIVATSFC
jgi:hypothetical protein